MAKDVLAEGFQARPLWWDALSMADVQPAPLPRRADVVVIGAGFTGLHTALVLARGGLDVVVVEAHRAGFGASTRNNGAVIPYHYLKLDAMIARYGERRGIALAATALDALEFFLGFVAEEGIDCDLQCAQRYFLARTTTSRDRLAALAARYAQSGLEIGWETIERDALTNATGVSSHRGGIVMRRSLQIDPARYHAALLARAREAGVTVLEQTPVAGIERVAGTQRVSTVRGPIDAARVVVATNAYTGAFFPWGRNRLLGIRAFKAATEPLPEALVARHFPGPRVLVNARLNHTVIRTTPDGRRLIVGGRAGMRGEDNRAHARLLHRDMVAFIPALRDVRFTHCWDGWMAFTFDKLPHYGEHRGVHFALGFCGVGITFGSWLGHRLGRRVLGDDLPPVPLDDLAFPGFALYRGQGWPVAIATAWINLLDRLK